MDYVQSTKILKIVFRYGKIQNGKYLVIKYVEDYKIKSKYFIQAIPEEKEKEMLKKFDQLCKNINNKTKKYEEDYIYGLSINLLSGIIILKTYDYKDDFELKIYGYEENLNTLISDINII